MMRQSVVSKRVGQRQTVKRIAVTRGFIAPTVFPSDKGFSWQESHAAGKLREPQARTHLSIVVGPYERVPIMGARDNLVRHR